VKTLGGGAEYALCNNMNAEIATYSGERTVRSQNGAPAKRKALALETAFTDRAKNGLLEVACSPTNLGADVRREDDVRHWTSPPCLLEDAVGTPRNGDA
jgi:hypothetical protein